MLLTKINEINLKLGIVPETQKVDTVVSQPSKTEIPATNVPGIPTDINQYGIFAQTAIGENGFITLENNKVELKISLKGGRVYSASVMLVIN